MVIAAAVAAVKPILNKTALLAGINLVVNMQSWRLPPLMVPILIFSKGF
jgi:hypothetical protein